MTQSRQLLALLGSSFISVCAYADSHALGDIQDLDDIRHWEIVPIEVCLDAAIDLIPGHARKVEMKIEGDDPVYEFDIDAVDGITYNVECNAEEGYIVEVEREVDANDPVFKKLAKFSEKEARDFALAIHPGKVVASEYEIDFEGQATYEFDIQTKLGYEVKVDVDAATLEIEEANVEIYEIGSEKE